MDANRVDGVPVGADARTGHARGVVPLLVLFSITVLLSAALLFVVQPMFARMVLPRLGGTPATWTTCLLFFQTALLLGYLYVHASAVYLRRRAQIWLHVGLLVAAAAMPIGLSAADHPDRAGPIIWLLITLTTSVGLPFFAVAATAPLLQRWYANASGRDPYFLYAASNAGSLAGLLGYPFLVERMFTLVEQRTLWTAGFVLLTMMIGACAAMAYRGIDYDATADVAVCAQRSPAPVITARQRTWWLALSFVPSSLLLGVTTHISTDVAAVPLLWVVPLALYLLTFIAAFASRPPISHRWTTRLAGIFIVIAIATHIVGVIMWWGLGIHLTVFAAAALACHRELAERRPAASELTQFYLVISAGGALGGVFNAVVAPSVFTQVLEYPLVLALAAALIPPPAWRTERREPAAMVWGLPVVVFLVVGSAWVFGTATTDIGANIAAFWTCAALILAFANRRGALGAALAVAVLANAWFEGQASGRVIFKVRSFFGVHRVVEDESRSHHRLYHGSTLHGWQNVTAEGCQPTSYYHHDGPIGQLFQARQGRAMRVGVIGLGAGALACYAAPGGHLTFFEIDPVVERIARDPAYFTFLGRAPGAVDVVIGDGRISLANEKPGTFDVFIVDAFSSDAIPVHLLTREFLQLAIDRLRPGGVVAFHISNRYLDLGPVLAGASRALGVRALEQLHDTTDPEATASRWVVVGRGAEDLAALARDPRWREPEASAADWTDDFSNIFDVLSWRGARRTPAD